MSACRPNHIKMKTVDIIVLGATGFTGCFTVKYLAGIIKKDYPDLTWGVAGRSPEKIENLIAELNKSGFSGNITSMECDVSNQDSLKNVARLARVLINCTGPNTILSEPVVQACIEMKTHYLDISAELYHILDMYIKYQKLAEDENVLVIPSCGYSALPTEVGINYLERNFKGTLNTVTCYAELELPKKAYCPGHCLVHYGTWESTVHVMEKLKEYLRLKQETFPKPLAPETDEMRKGFFHRHKGKFWFPYPGTENDVSQMSQRYLRDNKQKRPVIFTAYTTVPFFILYIIVPIFFLYYYLSYFKFFRRLLKKYPRVFTLGSMSHEGPSEEIRNATKFSFTLYGNGCRGNNEKAKLKFMTLKISSTDPGYRTTAIAIICAAITIIKDSDDMPRGGVIPPGAAFHDTRIVNRLSREGICYEITDSDP